MKYKPKDNIVIDAIQWNGNLKEIKHFLNMDAVYKITQEEDMLTFVVDLPDGAVMHMVDPTDYIVKYSDTDYQLFDAEQFHRRFERYLDN